MFHFEQIMFFWRTRGYAIINLSLRELICLDDSVCSDEYSKTADIVHELAYNRKICFVIVCFCLYGWQQYELQILLVS